MSYDKHYLVMHLVWCQYPGQTVHYGDTHTQARVYITVTPVPWLDHTLWWHWYPGPTINYDDTYTEARLYIMVTLVPWPDCKLWWHLHPGWTVYYGLTTHLGPYTMVIPASWPDPYYGDNPPPGWTIYYGNNFTHRPGHISWQHPVVRPDPHWPIRYSQLSTPTGHKIQPNQVHGLPYIHYITFLAHLAGPRYTIFPFLRYHITISWPVPHVLGLSIF